MTEDIVEYEEKKKSPFEQKLIYSALQTSGNNSDDFLDLLIEVNSMLLPNPAFQSGSFINKGKLRQVIQHELDIIADMDNPEPDINITLGDGKHRLNFVIDREFPEGNSVFLGTSDLSPDEEVQCRWNKLATSELE